jgi:DNA-binding MarR family transcriptional regulator
MTSDCCDDLLVAFRDASALVSSWPKNSRISLFSNEGKVLAAIMQGEGLIMKDIPHLTGVSFRSTFDCVRKLTELGVVDKIRDPNDKRAVTLKVNEQMLCQNICKLDLAR